MDIKQVIADYWKPQKNQSSCESKRIFGKKKASKEECLIALKSHDKEDIWYVYSGCSKHMTGNKDKFLNLKK
jgi:hypothetical protein